MDNAFAFDELTLKKMPHFLVLIILLLLGLPYVGLNLGINFGIVAENTQNTLLIESQIRGYFRQTLLEWSGFSLAAVTLLLAFTQYKLTNDKIALIIGLAILFSGSIEACHTLLINGLTININYKNNLDAFIWTLSNTISGLILLIGLIYLVYSKKAHPLRQIHFIVISLFLLSAAILITYIFSDTTFIPSMWFQNQYISRPYDFLPSLIYLSIIFFIYSKVYNKYPTILTHSIFYICLTQIVISFYLVFLSHHPYDGAYNIAYFLKVVLYFIPCICLIINYVTSYSDVLKTQKKLKLKQEELRYIASHDSLTNLFNRREFEDLLDKSISNSLRNKTSLALLLIDIDNFKATNDTFGHVHGDELLKQFANRLILLIRKGDLLARVGGDEFTLISPNIKSPSSARQLAERILNELNSPYLINNRLITATVSIGISIFPNDGRNTEKLLIKADLAMYKAKNSGKNTYQFYTEQLSYQQHRESEIEAHLRKALQNDEFELNYQPKYNLLTKEIVGAEILLRWDNSTLGYLSPNQFIPVAERSGLIIEIGNWVLHKALEQVSTWTNEYGISLNFSINISPIQLSHHQFFSNLKTLFMELNYTPQNLEFEITENILMADNNEITNVLDNIASLGIKIALDDFGIGYSSLNRLKQLPIDTLKIDKYFISDIYNKSDKVTIVDIIITLARELSMNIIAEGIETQVQVDYLVSKHCLYGQGFLLSEPLSKDDFTTLAFHPQEKTIIDLE